MKTSAHDRDFAASGGGVDPTADLVASAHLDIDAAPSVVYRVLSDLAHWPKFVPGISSVTVHDELPLKPGTIFAWRNNGFPLRSTLQVVDPGRELTWTGRALWITAVHQNVVDDLGGGRSRLTSSESMSGVGLRWMMTNQKLEGQLLAFVRAIAAEAEHSAA